MAAAAPTATRPLRTFGRFELRELRGKSARTMAWGAFDPRVQQALVLVLPRAQPADAAALERWLQDARKAARLSHPNLAPALEVGEHDRWPYIAYDAAETAPLGEQQGVLAVDAARWMVQALEALAFAHEAGAAHRDLQPHLMLVTDSGHLRVMGLEVASADGTPPPADGPATLSMDTAGLRTQRDAAHRDVLALGLVCHQLLAGAPVLDEPDINRAIERLAPLGRDIVRLPWTLPRPVPDALRAIVNRATDRQPRQRYHNARTLARALEGWLEAEAAQGGDAHALLLDRVRQIGVLPALPGGADRAARLALVERGRTNELADVVLKDIALAFELLRVVNTAQVRGSQVAGNGPVLTVRRAIAMIGLEGVRRAAFSLRAWPGPLGEPAAQALAATVERVARAARLAQALRPAGYDAEVVYLVALLQNLGRLVVQYHFPDEAAQIRRLMLPGEADEPGMSEEHAAFAVLGADIEAMGAAVARHLGLDDTVLQMVRRLPPQLPVRTADDDDGTLRAVASAANEAVDATALPPLQVVPALDKVAQRYARVLGLTPRDLQAALQASASTAAQVDEHERA